MQYLQGTKEPKLTIKPDYHPSWWVESSHAPGYAK